MPKKKKKQKRKPGKSILPILITLFVVVLITGYIPVSPPGLAARIEKELCREFADSCIVGAANMRLWSGLTLNDVTVFAAADQETSLHMKISSLTSVTSMIPLFWDVWRGQLAVGKTVGEEKSILSSSGHGHLDLFSECSQSRLLSHTRSVSMTWDSVLLVTQPAGRISLSPGKGTITLHRYRGGLTSVSATLTLNGVNYNERWSGFNGRCVVTVDPRKVAIHLKNLDLFDGTIRLRSEFNERFDTLRQADMTLQGLDIGLWSQILPDTVQQLGGRLNGSIRLLQSPFSRYLLRGSATLEIGDFLARKTSLQRQQIVAMLLDPDDELSFNRITANLTVRNDTLLAERIQARGEPLSLEAHGFVGTSGVMTFDCSGFFIPDYCSGLKGIARNTLETQDDGTCSFQCTLTGSVNNPRVILDGNTMKRAVNSVFQSLKSELQGLFR